MRQTSNLGLALYDSEDKMNITGAENSLNHNMELIDEAISNIPAGEQGEPGPKGDPGEPGAGATVRIGTVTTLEAGSEATVTNIGTDQNVVLDFGIPRGADGANGEAGTGDGVDLTQYRTAAEQDAIDSEQNEKINRSVFYDPNDNADEGKWLSDLLGTEIMRLSFDCDEEGNLTLYYGDNQVTSVQIVGGGGSSVEIIPCESIKLSVSSIKLRDIDTSYILSATPSPITTTQKVRWSTTDSNIATVSNDGTVTLTGKTGTVTINAICGSQSASCNITVISRITKSVYDFWTIMNNKGIVGGYEYIYINHLGNKTTNTSDCFSAPELPVIAGDKITGTFKSRGIPVCYYDSEGNIVWDALPYRPETSGKIVEYTVNSVVPEGVSYVKVSSMNSGSNIGTPYLTAYNIY